MKTLLKLSLIVGLSVLGQQIYAMNHYEPEKTDMTVADAKAYYGKLLPEYYCPLDIRYASVTKLNRIEASIQDSEAKFTPEIESERTKNTKASALLENDYYTRKNDALAKGTLRYGWTLHGYNFLKGYYQRTLYINNTIFSKISGKNGYMATYDTPRAWGAVALAGLGLVGTGLYYRNELSSVVMPFLNGLTARITRS